MGKLIESKLIEVEYYEPIKITELRENTPLFRRRHITQLVFTEEEYAIFKKLNPNKVDAYVKTKKVRDLLTPQNG